MTELHQLALAADEEPCRGAFDRVPKLRRQGGVAMGKWRHWWTVWPRRPDRPAATGASRGAEPRGECHPRELEERLGALPARSPRQTIFIDEVQRLPSLLNTIQVILDRPGNRLRFLLTGSSARKRAAGMQISFRRAHLSADRTEHGAEVDLVVELGRELWALVRGQYVRGRASRRGP